MNKAGRNHFRISFLCLAVLLPVLLLTFPPGARAEKERNSEDLEAVPKGNQDLQMIARQMEFLSGRLNRMPTPPKMDATIMINPGNDYVSDQGGQRNADEDGQEQGAQTGI